MDQVKGCAGDYRRRVPRAPFISLILEIRAIAGTLPPIGHPRGCEDWLMSRSYCPIGKGAPPVPGYGKNNG